MNPVELVLHVTWPLFQMYITGAGVETVYIVSPLPYSSYVYTYFKSQIEHIQHCKYLQ